MPGFLHPDGREIRAMRYHYTGFSVIAWLNESGDCEGGYVRHSDPSKRLVTLKPGEQFYVHGKLETLQRLEVYRFYPPYDATKDPSSELWDGVKRGGRLPFGGQD